jgi:hypothetical protein
VTNEQPELDRVIGALRSPATAPELAGEETAVDAMAATMVSMPATVRTFGGPRSLRVVAVVAASLIGMGGIAAAGAATFRPSADRGDVRSAATVVDNTVVDDTVVDDTSTTTISSSTTVPDDTVADDISDDTGAALVDDPATEFDETQCADGNHGATVSSIAKETPSGPGHGDEVSVAAQSSCGKDTDDTVADTLVTDTLVDDPATEFDETQCADGNHGATVSSIAKETPSGPGHGDEVSVAAQSSCGKNATDDDATDDTIADDGTDTTVASTDDDSPGNSDGHGNSSGHGSGTGNSGGNGNGRGNGKPGG